MISAVSAGTPITEATPAIGHINRAIQICAYLEEVSANGGGIYVRESKDSELQLLKMF
jgi:hypothetical protein